MQANSNFKPGISLSQFKNIFARCQCGVMTTRATFRNHYCGYMLTVSERRSEVIQAEDLDDAEDETAWDVVELTDSASESSESESEGEVEVVRSRPAGSQEV